MDRIAENSMRPTLAGARRSADSVEQGTERTQLKTITKSATAATTGLLLVTRQN